MRRCARAGLILAQVSLVLGACTNSPPATVEPTARPPSAAPAPQASPLPGTADPVVVSRQTGASTASVEPLLPRATEPGDVLADAALAERLDSALAAEEFDRLSSLLVLAEGRTVYERYFTRYFGSEPAQPHHVASVTATVVGTLVGIAIGEGMIRGVDQTVGELLPEHARDMSPAVSDVTLRQVLTNTAGFSSESPVDGIGRADDWIASVLRAPAQAPGEGFLWSDGGAHLLSAILVQATGMSVLRYARTRLFEPLGIASTPTPGAADRADRLEGPGFAWAVDPQGLHIGAYGLRLSAQDMARVGLLYLEDGKWRGRQVVPRSWVRRATRTHVEVSSVDGYGYQWWTSTTYDHQPFFYSASGSDMLLVVPSRDLVVAFQCPWDPAVEAEAPCFGDVRELVYSELLPLFAP